MGVWKRLHFLFDTDDGALYPVRLMGLDADGVAATFEFIRSRARRPGLAAQDECGQRTVGPAPVEPPRRPVHVLAPAGAGRHQLAGRVGDPLQRDPPQGLGRQPDLGRGAGPTGADVGVADRLAAGAFDPGLPQSTPSRHPGGARLASLTHGANPAVLIRRPCYADRRQSG